MDLSSPQYYKVEICRVTWHAASISVSQKKDGKWVEIVYMDMDGPECAIREVYRLIQMDYRIVGMALSHGFEWATLGFTLEGEKDAYRRDNEVEG